MKRAIRAVAMFTPALLLVVGAMTAALAADDDIPMTAPELPQARVPLPPQMLSGHSSVLAVAADDQFFDPITGRRLGTWEAGDLSDPNNPYAPGTPRGREPSNGVIDQGGSSTLDGIVQASRAQQWIRLPWMRVIARITYAMEQPEPGDIPVIWARWGAEAFTLSPSGAQHRYGEFPPVHVNSLAFGAVPVSFTIRAAQLRDDDDLPVPLEAHDLQANGPVSGKSIVVKDAQATGQINLSVSDLMIDGVPVSLGDRCETVRPIDVDLSGEDFYSHDPAISGEALPGFGPAPIGSGRPWPADLLDSWRTTKYYEATGGGVLQGSLVIPPFHGCGAGTEDLSTLVTSVASSGGNTIKTRQSTAYGICVLPGVDVSQASWDSSYWLTPNGSTPDGPFRCPDSVPFAYPNGGSDD